MAYQDEYSGAQAQMEEHERLIGFVVEDETGEKVGTVKAVWEDHTGQPAYLGVATGWLGLGRIHVVPVHYASISENAKRIRLPFAAETVKGAPDYDADYDITSEGESTIRGYYRDHGVDTDFNPDPGDPSMYISRGHGPAPAEGPDWTARANAPLSYGETAEEPTREIPAAQLPDAVEEDMDVREEEPEIPGERKGFEQHLREDLSDKDETTRGRSPEAGLGKGAERTIPLKEETLDVGKREVESGGVRLRKVIRSEQVNQPVELKREDIEIERVPARGSAEASDLGEDEIFIPLRREVPDVSKNARISEQVKLNKTVKTDRDEVREELRKEDVDIDREDRPLR